MHLCSYPFSGSTGSSHGTGQRRVFERPSAGHIIPVLNPQRDAGVCGASLNSKVGSTGYPGTHV
eukprot:1242394-Rhodomonas_salina.2